MRLGVVGRRISRTSLLRIASVVLTAAVACWAASYYDAWTGTAVHAFGPIEPHVAAWRLSLVWHFGVGAALVPSWLFTCYNLWQRRWRRPAREEFRGVHRTSS